MDQPVPQVTDKDVERIAIRDFGPVHITKVMDTLQEYGKQDWNRLGSPRVRLAILKLSNGDLDQLSKHTEDAIQDFRDVVSIAEYPRYTAEIGFEKVSKKIVREVIDDDWRQYREWLAKD